MIKGIGCDLVRIARLQRPLGNPRFVARIFTGEEQRLMALAGDPVTFAAGRWAAKEAVAKALGTGFAGCPPAAVSVEQGPGGEPLVRLAPCAAAAAGDRIHITISHDGEYAAAFAVVEGGCP
ncbi:MAG: holo-ACP synthase [Christensenellaceae bacterium]